MPTKERGEVWRFRPGCGCEITFFYDDRGNCYSRLLPGTICDAHIPANNVDERDAIMKQAKDAFHEMCMTGIDPNKSPTSGET